MPADTKPPERHHHGALRRALLDAGAEALAEIGPEALSLRDLARRVGVSHSAAAPHFGDKRGLLTALAAEGAARLTVEMNAAMAGKRTPRAALTAGGRGYLRFAERNPGLFRLVFSGAHTERDDPTLTAARGAAFAVLAEAMDRLAQGRTSRARDVRLALAWAAVHGLATLRLDGVRKRLTEPEVEAAMLALLAEACATPRARAAAPRSRTALAAPARARRSRAAPPKSGG
jgi:AcrR family transcriptional regulator